MLGIPVEEKVVPLYGGGEDDGSDSEVMRLWDAYGFTTPFGVRGIKPSSMKEIVEGVLTCKAESKGFFLCWPRPTTCQRMSINLLPAVVVAEEAKEYDWCTLLLDHLMHSIKTFAKRFYLDGFAKCCGGCTLFLAVIVKFMCTY